MAHGFHPLSHANKEVVLAVDFNKKGDRLATGSADHRIRVFEQQEGEWEPIEEWRAHNAEVTDLKFHPTPHPPLLASISPDLRLKLWAEDPSAPPLSGRRFTCIFSQSPPNPTPYASLAFSPSSSAASNASAGSGTVHLALITRDGLLSLFEPCGTDPALPNDWKELDSFFVCQGPVARGVETCFKVAFQEAERPSYRAIAAGVDERAMSLVVGALDVVKVYRVCPQAGWTVGGPAGAGAPGGVAHVADTYRFTAPVAELTGARGLVRDVAWCGATFGRFDLIATASADGRVRIYEVWVPKRERPDGFGEEVEVRGHRAGSFARRAGGAPSGIGAGLAGEEGGADDVVPHDWRLAAELRHEGVWKVEWIKESTMLLSAADTGRAHVWALGKDDKWLEFADFGPDTLEEE